MRLPWKRRRDETPAAPPRPNYTAIALMEHALFGIQPVPGSAAALALAMRQTGTCLTHQPVETTSFGEPVPNGMCTRCGRPMILDGSGAWTVV
ncbi:MULTISPECIES: hypothetical protein [unclassified Streptomyces]|uniref:hypothetical protein n=1 Tax=unclassified Streptomyces TaxID=2593676 RepID=UPI001F348534|nr:MULTISPECIES: hypothetical protein [unclassified Streptomyces]MCF0086611.1 hypothetical protein [Streptomyces sp. MH192]MCF0098765.1 hypothetical protein [Streptomyces sp. MH191]